MTDPVKPINTDDEWVQFHHRDTSLVVGNTYAYATWGYNENSEWCPMYTPVTIIKKARRGTDGERVECSDGINRYSHGGYIGRFRYDQHTKVLSHRRNPNYIPKMKPHVQLSLFDMEAEKS